MKMFHWKVSQLLIKPCYENWKFSTTNIKQCTIVYHLVGNHLNHYNVHSVLYAAVKVVQGDAVVTYVPCLILSVFIHLILHMAQL